jgi:hypothetical protein
LIPSSTSCTSQNQDESKLNTPQAFSKSSSGEFFCEFITMQYQEVFNVLDKGYQLVPLVGSVSLGLLGYFSLNISSKKAEKFNLKNAASYFVLFLCLLGFMASLLSVKHQWEIKHKFSSGKYEVIQGKVENFIPMPSHGHSLESFTVNG